MGPPEDERSLNLMEWSLQIIALAIIYFFNQVYFDIKNFFFIFSKF